VTLEQLSGAKIVIFSHYATTGACEELCNWLREQKIRELVYVAFPFGSSRDRFIRIKHFKHGELVREQKSFLGLKMLEPLAYAKDLFFAVLYGIRFARGADVLVAGDNLLSLAGLMIRRLVGIKRVIYYMIDYTPVRYANRLLNALYYAIDRLAAVHADVVWPLTSAIIQGRFTAGRLNPKRVRWYAVPYGSHPLPEFARPAFNPRQVIYMGDVVRNKGAELFVPMVLELKRLIPDFQFTVIGGGRDLSLLRDEIKKAGLEDVFEICGFIENIDDVVSRLAKAGIAIAPYFPHDANNFTFYSDPGKIKVYLGCGLPVVLTDVPPIAKDIEKEGAGKVVAYDPAGFAVALASLMNSEVYPRMRKQALRMGQRYAWPLVFTDAFSRLDSREGAHH
jgi:glycosyltransferase involved in cell wall biosynthesis